jgi:hypothetical protein
MGVAPWSRDGMGFAVQPAMKQQPVHWTVGSLAAAVALVACAADEPTMKIDHVEVSAVQAGFPPSSVALQMVVVLEAYNPNGYDVAIRAMRGTSSFEDRYSVPIDFRPDGDGVWLRSKQTTEVRVPVVVPVDTALRVAQEALADVVPYHVVGKADVTATSTLKIEKDDFGVDDGGNLTRQEIERSIAAVGIPTVVPWEP